MKINKQKNVLKTNKIQTKKKSNTKHIDYNMKDKKKNGIDDKLYWKNKLI